jgi:hypothetical protein
MPVAILEYKESAASPMRRSRGQLPILHFTGVASASGDATTIASIFWLDTAGKGTDPIAPPSQVPGGVTTSYHKPVVMHDMHTVRQQ